MLRDWIAANVAFPSTMVDRITPSPIQATLNDGERIQAAGAQVVQVNTGTGCHLEADMVSRALKELKPSFGSVVMIENVGNLVCPALFDLGERAKVAIISVTEGEDKAGKYPHMFRASDLVILNKIDLLPHLQFDLDLCIRNVAAVNPNVDILQLSAISGEGIDAGMSGSRRKAVSHGMKPLNAESLDNLDLSCTWSRRKMAQARSIRPSASTAARTRAAATKTTHSVQPA